MLSYVDQAAGLGCSRIRLTGGEPLLRPDFIDIYLHIRSQGVKVMLFTNGTLISNDMIAAFKKTPPGEPIEISLYGSSHKTYEAVTGNGDGHRAAMAAIRALRRNGVSFGIKSAWLPGIREEARKINELAQAIPNMPLPVQFVDQFDLSVQHDAARNATIRKLRAENDRIPAPDQDGPRRMQVDRQFCRSFMKPGGDTLFTCGAGNGSAFLDAYGTVFPCLFVRAPRLGYDLTRGDLNDALTVFFPSRLQKIRAADAGYLRHCARCFISGLCQQCPGKSWLEYGKLDKPVKYWCAQGHKKALQLGLLKKREAAWRVTDGPERKRSVFG